MQRRTGGKNFLEIVCSFADRMRCREDWRKGTNESWNIQTWLLTETWGERMARTQVAFHFFLFLFFFTINSLNENMIMCNYRYNNAEWDECDSHSPTWQRTDRDSEESFLHSNNVQLGLVLIYSWHNNCYRNEHYHRYFAKEFLYYYCSCILFMLSVWRTYWAAR